MEFVVGQVILCIYHFRKPKCQTLSQAFEEILCKIQWNSIIKSEIRPTLKWNWNWNECQLVNFSKFGVWLSLNEWIDNHVRIFSFNHIFSNTGGGRKDSSQLERTSFNSNVSTVLLYFKERKWECSYMREPDLMLKYSTLLGLFVFLIILIIQTMNNAWVELYNPRV